MSSNSVTSVHVLDRFHGLEEEEGELLSSTDAVEGDEGSIGADKKWKPRGVGKWSLRGDSHDTIFSLGDWAWILRFSGAARLCGCSTSSSIIVLSNLPGLRSCDGEGGRYVVDGKRTSSGIFGNF